VSANLDLVRSIYANWERGDYSSARWADTEIEYTVDDFGPLVAQTWTGLTGMAEGARSIIDVFELARIEADEYRELDAERVLVLDRRSGTLKQSGIGFGTSTALPAMGAHLFQIANGKVTRLVMYSDRDRAFADLGLAREGDAADSAGQGS
jgi:ketosteroid isomerase-like protein